MEWQSKGSQSPPRYSNTEHVYSHTHRHKHAVHLLKLRRVVCKQQQQDSDDDCVCLFPFFCDQILATLTLILSVWLKGWQCWWVCWSPGVHLNHYQVKTFSVCLFVSKSVLVMTLQSATAVLCVRCSVVKDMDFSIPVPAADSRSYLSLFLNLCSVHIALPNLNHSQSLRVLVTHLIRSS